MAKSVDDAQADGLYEPRSGSPSTPPSPVTPPDSSTSSDHGTLLDGQSLGEKKLEISSLYDVAAVAPLAPAGDDSLSSGASLLQFFGFRKYKIDPDAIATPESVFDGPFGVYYLPNEKWENKAAFDPAFRWTHRDAKVARRKADLKVLLWIIFMFISLNLCRYSLQNATADNFLADLKLTQADYNFGNSLSKIGFLVAELPSQMIGKKIGVDIWLPTQMVIFGTINAAQFWLKGRTSFLATRFFLAFFQGGFIPDAILYLSYFYNKNELPVRLALFWCVNSSTSLLNSFLAVGILEMRGLAGHAGWRYYFLIIGLISVIIGIASFFMLSPGPSQTKTRFRPNGFFTDHDVKVIVNKIVRDDPGKATMHNRQMLSPKLLWKSLLDYDLWPMYIIGLTFDTPATPVLEYFQISMRELGFSRLMSNLLSVPHTVLTVFFLITLTLASELINNRTWLCAIENWWFLPFFVSLRALPDPINPWTYFALSTLLLGYPYAHAIQAAWCSRNSGSVRTRTVSASVYNMFVQASGIIGSNLYVASDKPRYFRGNSIIIGLVVGNILVIYPFTYFYYKYRNAQKEKIWGKMTLEERANYLATTSDEGCKRLDFRFVY